MMFYWMRPDVLYWMRNGYIPDGVLLDEAKL